MSGVLLVLAALAVAASNGANDNFKGVATLYGSGTASYRTSLAWACLTTFAGALAATALGARLAAAFSGGGLLPAAVVASPWLLPCVAAGAALTVALAVRLGLPVSTTHAILGALLGAGGLASAGQVDLGVLARRFIAPLLLSPVIAFVAIVLAYPVLGRLRRALGVTRDSCLCVDPVLGVGSPDGTAALTSATGVVHTCDRSRAGHVLGVDAGQLVAGAHFLSAGFQGFARGLNDTPKIAALLLGASVAGPRLSPGAGFVLVALVMLAGGWLGSRRVAETMSHRITPLNEGQALTSNALTAGLVLAASSFALPVSMTHVAIGSLAGLGWRTGEARWSTLRSIAFSWLLTLPLAAGLAAAAFMLAERIHP